MAAAAVVAAAAAAAAAALAVAVAEGSRRRAEGWLSRLCRLVLAQPLVA